MFKTFSDPNADKMRELAKAIPAPTEKFQSKGHDFSKAASGGIAKNFFDSEPSGIRPLSTDDLVTHLAGGENAQRARVGWKDALRAMFPTVEEMWSLPRPDQLIGGLVEPRKPLGANSDHVSIGGTSWPSTPENVSSAKAADLEALALSLGWSPQLASSLKARKGKEFELLSAALTTLAKNRLTKALATAASAA